MTTPSPCPCCAGEPCGPLLDLCGPCLDAHARGYSATCRHLWRAPRGLPYRARLRGRGFGGGRWPR